MQIAPGIDREGAFMPFSSYDHETREILYAAYDAALLEAGNAPPFTRSTIIERLTQGLLNAADSGERDPDKLRLAALRALL
jgi:hypothetical protein